jgi:hypothetical protein
VRQMKTRSFDPETEDTDPAQRPLVHSTATVTAAAELGLWPAGLFRLMQRCREPENSKVAIDRTGEGRHLCIRS